MQITLDEPSFREHVPTFGVAASDHEFQCSLAFGQFKQLVPDPSQLEDNRVRYNPELQPTAALRKEANRILHGPKKANVDAYAEYLYELQLHGSGFAPQIVLYSPAAIETSTDPVTGLGYLKIPHNTKLIALDGDTQTTARYRAEIIARERGKPNLFDRSFVKVVIVHGISLEEAKNIFADCNSKGVKVNVGFAMSMDSRDPLTQLTKHIEQNIPVLRGRVNTQKRQLTQSEPNVITFSALRTAALCFEQGINGVQNQTNRVPVDDERLALLKAAAPIWFQAVVDELGQSFLPASRANSFAASPGVWAALGALGHDAWEAAAGTPPAEMDATVLRQKFREVAHDKLAMVDWSRGEHWLSSGAKRSGTGAITLGGPKEAGGFIYRALKEGTVNINRQQRPVLTALSALQPA